MKQATKDYINADSQTTVRCEMPGNLWSVDDRTRYLVSGGYLRVGHGTFRGRHHFIYLILRGMREDYVASIAGDVHDACVEALGSEPDLILFPSDSTVAFLIQGDAFSCRKAILSPVSPGYGITQLHAEIGQQHLELLKSQESIRVLFLDDSMNSGATESYAQSAYERARTRNGGDPRRDKWLTYAVLERGLHRYASVPKKLEKKTRSAFDEAHVASYTGIGPQSRASDAALIVEATRRLVTLGVIVRHMGPAVGDLVARSVAAIQGQPLQRPGAAEAVLEDDATCNFLYLCNLPMVCAVEKIASIGDDKYSKCVAGYLYLAMYHDEVMAYVDYGYLRSRIVHCAARIAGDDRTSEEILMLGAALLPTSVLLSVSEQLIRALLQNSKTTLAIGVLGLVLAGAQEKASFLDYIDARDSLNRDQGDRRGANPIRHRVSEYVKTMADFIQNNAKTCERRRRTHWDLLSANFAAISGGGLADDIVGMSRKLVALVYEGDHKTFLPRALADVNFERLNEGVRNLRHVINCCDAVCKLIHIGAKEKPEKLKGSLDQLESEIAIAPPENKDELLRAFKRIRDDTFQYAELRGGGVLAEYIHSPSAIQALVYRAYNKVKEDLDYLGLEEGAYLFENPAADLMSWRCLGPAVDILVAHYENLLRNVIKHMYGSESGADDRAIYRRNLERWRAEGGQVLAVHRFALDRTRQNAVLCFSCRGKKADESRMFMPTNGLGSARMAFQLFGGNVLYQYATGRLPGSGGEWMLPSGLPRNVRSEMYRNHFLTRMPLIMETRM